MRICIFHYHFLPGGVTSVVRQALRALSTNHRIPIEWVLVSGKLDHTEQLQRELPDIPLRIHHLPELDYLEGEPTTPQYSALLRSLQSLRGGVWWIHNYHLGKNPLFTRALIEVLFQHKDQIALLHIHDFPEEARFPMLQQLIRFCGSEVYPILPHLRYITINSRDYQNMRRIGILSSHLFMLENPMLPTENKPSSPLSEIRKKLERFSSDFPGYRPSAPTWLYPVRSIRRKNILEAGLLAKSYPFNLVVSLPGLSSSERAYSATVEEAFRSGTIPGLWGIGAREDALPLIDLAAISEGIISSSVQEGFGYQFSNSRIWNKPLLARRIPTLENLLPLLKDHPHHFYEKVLVPIDKETRKNLLVSYNVHIKKLHQDIPFLNIEKALKELETLHEVWDFSLLSVKEQRKMLNTVSPPTVRELNPDILQLPKACADPLPFPESYFGASVFAQNFIDIVKDAQEKKEGDFLLSLQGMLDIFTDLSSLRLLAA